MSEMWTFHPAFQQMFGFRIKNDAFLLCQMVSIAVIDSFTCCCLCFQQHHGLKFCVHGNQISYFHLFAVTQSRCAKQQVDMAQLTRQSCWFCCQDKHTCTHRQRVEDIGPIVSFIRALRPFVAGNVKQLAYSPESFYHQISFHKSVKLEKTC